MRSKIGYNFCFRRRKLMSKSIHVVSTWRIKGVAIKHLRKSDAAIFGNCEMRTRTCELIAKTQISTIKNQSSLIQLLLSLFLIPNGIFVTQGIDDRDKFSAIFVGFKVALHLATVLLTRARWLGNSKQT